MKDKIFITQSKDLTPEINRLIARGKWIDRIFITLLIVSPFFILWIARIKGMI